MKITKQSTRRVVVILSAIFTAAVLIGVSQPYFLHYQNSLAKIKLDASFNPLSRNEVAELEKPLAPIAEDPLPRIHVVQPGETLSSISKLYYGNTKYWKALFDANKDQIHNKHKLKPGTQLLIPYQPGE